MFSPISSGVIVSIMCAFSSGPTSIPLMPGIFSTSSMTVSFASLSSPAIRQSQSIGSGMFSSRLLLMLWNAATTFAPVPFSSASVLFAADPSFMFIG